VADNILRFVDVVHLLLVRRCCFYAKIATVRQHLQSLQSVTYEHTEKVTAVPCRIATVPKILRLAQRLPLRHIFPPHLVANGQEMEMLDIHRTMSLQALRTVIAGSIKLIR